MKKVFLGVCAGTIIPKDLWILNMVKGTVLLLLVQAVIMLVLQVEDIDETNAKGAQILYLMTGKWLV